MVVNKKEEQELQKQQAATYQQTPYQESDLVKQAQTMIQNQLAQKPGQYQSPWQTQLNDVIGKVMNREKFSYDLNADALYKQYADKFITQGKMAMMDTMGQAQAMTGGYGNSYAQNVGQQAYHGQLQQLNDKIPELYQLALSKYQMEGNDLKDHASLIAQMENQDYGRYRDTVSDYNSELDRLYGRYDTERDYDYGKWADNRDFSYGQYVDDRNFGYQQDRDKISDEQWQKEFDEDVRRWEASQQKSSGGGGGGGSKTSKTPPDGFDTWDEYWEDVYRRRYEAEQATSKKRGSAAKDTSAMLK